MSGNAKAGKVAMPYALELTSPRHRSTECAFGHAPLKFGVLKLAELCKQQGKPSEVGGHCFDLEFGSRS